jgi:hypothetical protein
MVSKRPERRRWLAAVAALLLPLAAVAQQELELMLCGSSSTASNGAGFVDTLPGSNPQAPAGGTTAACMPVQFFDTGLSRSPPPPGSSGADSLGAPVVGKVTVVMPSGPNAVRLSALLARGAPVGNLTLLRTVRATAGGARQVAFAVVLADATIDSSQTSALAGGDTPTETIVIGYARIRWSSWLDPLAGGAPSSSLCYDAAARLIC